MKKISTVIIVGLLLLSMFSVLASCVKAEEQLKCPSGDDVQISNSYLILSVFDGSGSISLSTASGQLLLYPSDTSNLALKVDGIAQNSHSGLGSYMTKAPTIVSSDSVFVQWRMAGITLGMTYKLVNENLEVTAILENVDSISHTSGTRFLLDTMLGPDDGAPLYAPDIGVKTYETDIQNPTFNYWKAYDFYPNPSIEAYSTLITIPNRVVFGWWPTATGSLWDYSVNQNQQFYTPGYTSSPESDSCVIMYFDPLRLDPGASRAIVFSYGLSPSIESWKNSIISELDSYQSYMTNILSSAIDNYANMMLEFNKLGVEHHITIFKDSAEQGAFGSTDWKSNALEIAFLLDTADLVKEYNQLSVLKSIDITTLEDVPAQIGRAITDASNEYKWGWVSRDLKASGIAIVLFALDLVVEYSEKVQMQNGFDQVVSFNNKLSSVYASILNSPVDLATIKNALYNSFGNDVESNVKTIHDQTVQFISSLTLPQGVDTNYFLKILRGINGELRDVYGYQRNIFIAGDQKYSLSDMNAYRTTVDTLYNNIVNAESVSFAADCVSGTSAAAGLALSITGVGGAAGAACWLASLTSSAVSLVAKTYSLTQEQGLFNTMLQGSQALFQLSYSLPMIADEINSLSTKTLESVIQPQSGQFTIITAHSEWSWRNLRYDTYFHIMVENQATEDANGFVVFHVRSLDQDLKLADMNYEDIGSIYAQTSVLFSAESMVHFSFWGGNYEARFELWLGPLRVDWETVQYNVGIGGGIQSNTVMQGDIERGHSQSAYFDSTGDTWPSVVTLNYGGSEVNLHAYDTLGNHLGINYQTGYIDTEIPGAEYSGPMPSIEWMILLPGTYNLQAVCISAEPAGENFLVMAMQLTPLASDAVPPTTRLQIEPPTFIDSAGNTHVASSTLFNLTAEDNFGGSGVASTAYKIDNATYDSGWVASPPPIGFYLTGLADGQYSIDYNSTDNAGNVEPTNTQEVILDNTPPTTTLTIGEPKYISDKTCVTPDTLFTLEGTDTGSGVYSIGYRIYNAAYDSVWQTYTAPFKLTSLADGTYTIEYNSTDNVGNVEATHQISITLFSWDFVFKDSDGRGTTLKVNTAYKFFQFIAPNKDFGLRYAAKMTRLCKQVLVMCYEDKVMWLTATAVDDETCLAVAWDKQTCKAYWLIEHPPVYKLTVCCKDTNGKAISSASVYLNGCYKGQTDSNGKLAITNVLAGSYSVTAKKCGYKDSGGTITVTGDATLTLTMTPQTYTLTVFCKDSKGKAVSGASVYINGNYQGVTDSSGKLAITNITAGTCTVTAKKGGYKDTSVNVTVTGDKTITITMK